MTWSDFLVGLAAGLVVAAAAYGLVRWRFERAVAERARRNRPGPGPQRAPDPPAGRPIVPDPPTPVGLPPATDHLPMGPVGDPLAGTAPPSPIPSPARPGIGLRGIEDDPTLRLSQRVLVHLLRHGGSSSQSEAVTQRGIMAALNSSQGALSSVLRRLEDGGAIASEKAHVGGRDRRVKVYVLTPRGRDLVAAVPRPAGPQGGPGRSPSPSPSPSPTL